LLPIESPGTKNAKLLHESAVCIQLTAKTKGFHGFFRLVTEVKLIAVSASWICSNPNSMQLLPPYQIVRVSNMDKAMNHSIACETCDLLLTAPQLNSGERAKCPRCGTIITELEVNSFQRGLALSISALLFLVSTFYFPMLGFSIQGQQRSMTLLDSGIALISNDQTLLGALVIFLIITLPILLLVMLIVLLIGLLRQVSHPSLILLGRGFYYLRKWNMVEVYLIGVLVSLSKIASLAEVNLGLSFWSLLGFCLCFLLAMYSVDRHQVWHSIKQAMAPGDN